MTVVSFFVVANYRIAIHEVPYRNGEGVIKYRSQIQTTMKVRPTARMNDKKLLKLDSFTATVYVKSPRYAKLINFENRMTHTSEKNPVIQ